jgi:hypothetical protein
MCGSVGYTLEEAHNSTPPTMISFKTTDGVWLQFVGGNVPKDMPKLLRCIPNGLVHMSFRTPLAILIMFSRLVTRKHKAKIFGVILEQCNVVLYGFLKKVGAIRNMFGQTPTP